LIFLFTDIEKMYKIKDKSYEFPSVELSDPDGLLAYGGDLSITRLIAAYENGIFPWYDNESEILWWSPDPRMVLFPKNIHISKSMKQLMRRHKYKITENQAFEKVIHACSIAPRQEKGTWLVQEMIDAYIRLYHNELAYSIEVWNQKDELVGGLYGTTIVPQVFSGESMFSLESNTSKLAFIHLAQIAIENNYKIIDCQLYTPHLASLGATEIPRKEFLKFLNKE